MTIGRIVFTQMPRWTGVLGDVLSMDLVSSRILPFVFVLVPYGRGDIVSSNCMCLQGLREGKKEKIACATPVTLDICSSLYIEWCFAISQLFDTSYTTVRCAISCEYRSFKNNLFRGIETIFQWLSYNILYFSIYITFFQ